MTVLVVDPDDPAPGPIADAAAVLRGGGLVAFPTETVYGLGADALDPAAVARIFAAKGRPADDPLIVHVADAAGLAEVASSVPPAALALARLFWPGPLTLVVPRSPAVPSVVSGGRDTVAVRVPDHPVALALLRALGRPVAAPSANRFGRISPTTAADVVAELGDRVDVIVDGGPTTVGVESTVLDVSGSTPVLLRPGAVTLEMLRGALERVDVAGRADRVTGATPGRYVRHYAPTTPLVLVEAADRRTLGDLARAVREAGVTVGVLALDGDPLPKGIAVVPLGDEGRPAEVARRLYPALREADRLSLDVLLARTVPDSGIGWAVNDRLWRAASGRTVSDAGDGAARTVLTLLDPGGPPQARRGAERNFGPPDTRRGSDSG